MVCCTSSFKNYALKFYREVYPAPHRETSPFWLAFRGIVAPTSPNHLEAQRGRIILTTPFIPSRAFF